MQTNPNSPQTQPIPAGSDCLSDEQLERERQAADTEYDRDKVGKRDRAMYEQAFKLQLKHQNRNYI